MLGPLMFPENNKTLYSTSNIKYLISIKSLEVSNFIYQMSNIKKQCGE